MPLFTFSNSYALGLLFILLVAVIWSGSSVLVQYIFQDLDFQSPFLVTYICNSLFLIYLPLWQLWISLGLVEPTNVTRKFDIISTDENDLNTSRSKFIDNNNTINGESKDTQIVINKSYSHYDVIKIAIYVAPIWFIANCLYSFSLFMTSVSSTTIICNLSGVFTLTIAYFLGLEDITLGKVLGIIFCFVGVVLVALQDNNDGSKSSTAGDIIALLAAVGYGLYNNTIRLKVQDDQGISMQLLFGYVGLVNALLGLPILIVMIVINFHDIMQSTLKAIGFIALNGFCDNFLSDYLWARAVLLTSPTIATISTSITIPIAIMSDILLGRGYPTLISTIGALLVIFGFIFVHIDNHIWINLMKYIKSLIRIID